MASGSPQIFCAPFSSFSLHQEPILAGNSNSLRQRLSDEIWPFPEQTVSEKELLAFLEEPASYGFDDQVDRLDIGDSVLFLAGPYCYKYRRKTVGSSAANSTELRYAQASAELKLGALFAPDLYVRLVPICLEAGKLHLQDITDEASVGNKPSLVFVDWLICMHRYDATQSYDKLVEKRQPNFSECSHLTQMVLKSHRLGHKAHAKPWVQNLHDQLEAFDDLVLNLDTSKDRCQFHACLMRAKARLVSLEHLIEARGDRGLIRQIHGDVILNNVVSLPSGLRLVNPAASSSNKALRGNGIGDPLYDLASLLSDLWSRGLMKQANWILSHYCNHLLDSRGMDGLQALDLYLFCRAMERSRALYHGLQKADPSQVANLGNCGNRQAMKQFLHTARESLLQDEASIIVLGGGHASDRSRLARILAPSIGRMPGALHLSAEREILALHEIAHADALPTSSNRHSVWHLVYRRLCTKAEQAIEAGYSAILDGRFESPHTRAILEAMLASDNIRGHVSSHCFWLCEPATSHRYRHAPSADLETHTQTSEISSDAQTNDFKDYQEWHALDVRQPADRLIQQVLHQMDPAWHPQISGLVH